MILSVVSFSPTIIKMTLTDIFWVINSFIPNFQISFPKKNNIICFLNELYFILTGFMTELKSLIKL